MSHLKKLTILHSNDLHGDFLAEEIDAQMVGGVSMLSGYGVRSAERKGMPFTVLPVICFAVR